MTTPAIATLSVCLGLALSIVVGSCSRRIPGVASQSAAENAAAVRLNNLGVAEMNRGRSGEAVELFRRAFRQDGSLFAARLNEGIALLNNQRFDEARAVLLNAVQLNSNSARAWYNLGILYRNLGENSPAVEAFEQVTKIDPDDADAFYFLGQLHAQAGRYDQAVQAYERCLALDSLHLSAEFGLARAHQISGNDEAARRHLERFDQLTQSGLAKPISLTYGEQGPYSTAEPVAGVSPVPEGFTVRFAALTAQSGLRFQPRTAQDQTGRILPMLGAGACFTDVDSDGRFDLLLPGDVRGVALYRNTGSGEFTDVTARSGLDTGGESLGCTVGDYDNDGQDDVVVGFQDRIGVYRNQGNGTFQDVTSSTGIRVEGLPLGLVWVDYDHDGDLDLYISRFSNFALGNNGAFNFPFEPAASPNLLWRNNGNGTFSDSTATAGLGGDAPGIAALPLDFNNDRAVDLLLTGWRTSAALFTNSREGPFRPADVWKPPFPAAAAGAVAFDMDKDGWMDVALTHWAAPGLSVWRNAGGNGFERLTVPEPQWSRGWGIAALDIDNDGWIDLAAAGEGDNGGEIRLLRNLGQSFTDVTTAAGLLPPAFVRPRALVAGDIDGDGDSDLLLTQNGGAPVLLRNNGGNRRGSVRLTLRGLNNNRSGIGTKVEVFSGPLRQKWEVASASGYLGQGAPEILAGIDNSREADIVRLLWPTGVPQDEVQLASGRRHLVREIDRRGSSCPVVFVWNGERYEFVSDMIGPGIVGHWVGPGQRNVSDPTEYLKIDGGHIKPKNGRLSFRFAEVMEELVYLDQVRLLAIDHPADVVVNPNEYFAAQPPFPEFKVVTSRGARRPRAASDGQGRNVLPELLERDRRYVTGFGSLPYAGFAEMHYLELDLGNIGSGDSLRLIMHGFIDYFSATSVYAAHQAGVQAVVPFLEVQTSGDNARWVRVLDDIGFPAGLARTMVADLSGRLPGGVSRIRIGTNLKIFWDQILIDVTPQALPFLTHEIPLAEASLAFRGYPRQVEHGVRGDVSYLHDDASRTGPYAVHAGHYTAYGDVLDIVKDVDDRFAILGSGDEVALEFDPSSAPAVQPGWVRDYFFYADGFAKDMDFYEAHSGTVEPLPFHAMGRYPYGPEAAYPLDKLHLEYRLRSNTRDVSGSGAIPSFRFQYH